MLHVNIRAFVTYKKRRTDKKKMIKKGRGFVSACGRPIRVGHADRDFIQLYYCIRYEIDDQSFPINDFEQVVIIGD